MHRFFLLYMLVYFTSCSPRIESRIDPTADFSQYRTFDFHETEVENQTGTIYPPGMALLKAAIEREFNARGIQRSENPDLLVNIGIVVSEEEQTYETNIRDAPAYTGQRRYTWESEEIVVGTYAQGTLVLEAFDAASDLLLWQASGSGVLPKKEKKLDSSIRKGVGELFETFPFP